MNETTATTRRRPISCQAPLCFTQPPQYRGRGSEGPGDKHYACRFSYLLGGHADGLYGVLYYQGFTRSAVRGAVLDLRGVGGPLALRARQHDDVGFSLQCSKHTCGVLLSQDAEDHAEGPVSVRGAHPGERRREPRRVVPPIDHHGDTIDLVYLEPSRKGLPNSQRDLLPHLGGESPFQ